MSVIKRIKIKSYSHFTGKVFNIGWLLSILKPHSASIVKLVLMYLQQNFQYFSCVTKTVNTCICGIAPTETRWFTPGSPWRRRSEIRHTEKPCILPCDHSKHLLCFRLHIILRFSKWSDILSFSYIWKLYVSTLQVETCLQLTTWRHKFEVSNSIISAMKTSGNLEFSTAFTRFILDIFSLKLKYSKTRNM